MKGILRITALLGLVAFTLGVMWIVGRKPTEQQPVSLRPAVDRVVEAKATLDRVGQGVLQASDAEEIALGERLSQEIPWLRFHAEAAHGQPWLREVMQRLAEQGGLRRGHHIRHQIRVVDHPAINAFALPGGHIFVTTGMLAALESEAEAAAVIGHEMAHVDLRHCIERYQYELKARQLGGTPAAAMASLGCRLMLQGFQDEQELEADRWGMQLAARAGYHPQGGQALFRRMLARLPRKMPPRTLSSEAVASGLDVLEDLFASHPRLSARMANLEKALGEAGIDPQRQRYYLGVRNRREFHSRSQREYPEEWVLRRLSL